MNDRIQQLAKQAGLDYMPDSDLLRFANLIVKECAKKCDEFGDRLEDERPNKDLGVVAYECADGIKRMFGVEK